MNRRDYFAAQALNAMISRGIAGDAATLAKNAYEYADAMIAARPPNDLAISEMAHQIADRIEYDLKSRQGLCHAWTSCSADSQLLIKQEWVSAIRREILRYFKQEMT